VSRNFHAQNFDESTKAKLEIFQLYARTWLPTFLAPLKPTWKEVHVYDFFCGPGSDPTGVDGSPVRIVQELLDCRGAWVANGIKVHLHFYDASAKKTQALQQKLAPMLVSTKNVVLDVQALPFGQAFPMSLPTLKSKDAAKLILLDPCGVNFVDEDIFRQITAAPVADFLLFMASSYLHRFREVDSIKVKIKHPDNPNHVHRVVLETFKEWVPAGKKYYLAPYSLKKGKNIYGIIFGSGKMIGMDKFLTLAWKKAPISGEANYDIDGDNHLTANPELSLFKVSKTKVEIFEARLREAILAGKCPTEQDVIEFCFDQGMLRQHAAPVLKALKDENRIQYTYKVPKIERFEMITLLRQIAAG